MQYAARRAKEHSRASTFSSTLAPARKSPSRHFPVHARAGSTGAHGIVGSSDKMFRAVRWVRTVDTGASEVRNDLLFEHFPLCTVSPSVSPAREHSRPLRWRKAGAHAAVLLWNAQGHHDTHPSRAAPRAEAMRARATRWTGPTMRGVGRAVSRRREGVLMLLPATTTLIFCSFAHFLQLHAMLLLSAARGIN